MYTQVKLQYEPFDKSSLRMDIIWIPTRYAKEGKIIITDKPYKRLAKVLEVYISTNKVGRKLWNNNI